MTPVLVSGRADDLIGIASTASQGQIGQADLRRRPLMQEGELPETVLNFLIPELVDYRAKAN